MKPSGTTYLTQVVVYTVLGVLLSSESEYVAAFLSFVVAGGHIAYYREALATAEALKLADECLAGWKKALEETET